MKGAPVFYDSLQSLAGRLSLQEQKCLLLCDTNTHVHCLPLLQPFLGENYKVFTATPGEKNKQLETCSQLWDAMHAFQMGKTDLLLALGGGVITDLAGFCASVYKRGIRTIFIPTTVMGMCDAGIGGKNGVDFRETKNVIGTFYNPEEVAIWTGFTATLPEREKINGLAEIIKSFILQGKQLAMLSHASALNSRLPELIRETALFKWQVVQSDPFDRGNRQVLNFGHSIGHAIESCFLEKGDSLLHGEAIAAGILMEAFISRKKFGLSNEWLQEVLSTIDVYFPRLTPPEADKLLGYLYHDKKNISGHLCMSLMQSPQVCKTAVEVSPDEVRMALEFYITNTPAS